MGNLLDCTSNEVPRIDPVSDIPQTTEPIQNSVVVERRKPVLQSCIWKLQREYYESLTSDAAVAKSSSFSISSNCYVARAYANVIMSYVLDWYSNPLRTSDEPLYIIDVGAGFGKLGFLIMYHLFEMKESWPTTSQNPFIYVLTDFSKAMLSYWECDPLISQFVKMGYMDYGLLDVEHAEELHLRRANVTLTVGCLQAPPFFLCSSVFSCIPQDVVMVDGGCVMPATLSILQGASPSSMNRNPIEGYQFSWNYEKQDLIGWSDDIISILQEQAKEGIKAIYVVPVIAISFIHRMQRLCDGHCVFLVVDDGVFSTSELNVVRDPVFNIHGSIRLPVNYPLLEQITHQQGGFILTSSLHENFRAVLFGYGMSPSSLVRTRLAYRNSIVSFTPESFFTFQKSISDETTLSLRSMQCLLRLSSFDPDLLYRYRKLLIEFCNTEVLIPSLHEDLHIDLVHVRDHTLFQNPAHDICFELARIHMGLKEYDLALELFQDSNNCVSEHYVTWHNMGICCYYLKEFEKAKQCFMHALEMKPTYVESKMWLERIAQGDGEVASSASDSDRLQESNTLLSPSVSEHKNESDDATSLCQE